MQATPVYQLDFVSYDSCCVVAGRFLLHYNLLKLFLELRCSFTNY